MDESPSQTPRRILLIRPSALGDVCRTVPVLVSLRRAWPHAEIDWLVQDTFLEAVARHPDLTRAIPFPRARFGKWWLPWAMRDLALWMRELSDREYDLVVDCQGLLRSGLISLATRAGRRVGYANAEEAGWVGLTQRVHVPRDWHAVDRMLELARAAGAEPVPDLRLYTARGDREWAAPRAQPEPGAPYAVLAPTSRWPGKRWPPERFAELARRLIGEARFARVILVGGKRERDQCGPLLELGARESRVVDLIGQTSVGTLMALLETAGLVIANDSAALHMAVGFGRPLVALYGPTDARRVGPYGRLNDVLQHAAPGEPLDHKDEKLGRGLMERISIDEVMARVAVLAGP
ncbi:MAG: glycosyltransferase family 9 protein [Phycisphaerae bacterium]|nr:glycosyltransferase family 9 protein [Phycisphaerae bacterium]